MYSRVARNKKNQSVSSADVGVVVVVAHVIHAIFLFSCGYATL